MRLTVGVLNIVLGMAYTTYGVITISDMKREWKTLGFSHFGMAWVFMAFTCGPHHLAHGTHVLLEGRAGGPLDLLAVAVGLPAGIAFLSLRMEASLGGRGDRFISGTPGWLHLMPMAAAAYVTVLAAGALQLDWSAVPRQVTPNLMLVVLYVAIGYFVLRTQLRNRARMYGWSVSGLSLGIVFPTCAMMHGVYAMYATTGLYHDIDFHGLAIDWLSVPAAMYFLWVVRSLYRQSLRDWNRPMMDAAVDRTVAVTTR